MVISRDPRIGFISSYIPRKCGIATFTNDLATAISTELNADAASEHAVRVVALSDRLAEYEYGPEVLMEVYQPRRDHYRDAAEVINTGLIDVVSLQHEYGLFGGSDGKYIIETLERLTRPVVTTLHTVLSEPTQGQKTTLSAVAGASAAVVVMAERAKTILRDVYDVPEERIRLIHHGVPDLPLSDTGPFKERFGLADRPMTLTFGLLSPGKGIETMLEAMAHVVAKHPEAVYVILGETHPGVRRESGEMYRISLERKALELGIQENVQFHNRYVSKSDLRAYLQAADFYATPYRAKEQITSGTLAYALAAGKAIVSTPYWHAQELLADGRGKLVEFEDAEGFAQALIEWLENPDEHRRVCRNAHAFGRSMIWPRVAQNYIELCTALLKAPEEPPAVPAPHRKVLMRLSIPEVRLNHLREMTDDTGVLQHAKYCTPDRHHGYCTDDNARALVVASMTWSLFQDESMLPLMRTYLSFLSFAHWTHRGRFRNFMSYHRQWLEEDGSDDSQGRAIWSLGHLISHTPFESMRSLALDLLARCGGVFRSIGSPRSWAFSILGLHYYLRQCPDDRVAQERLAQMGSKLNKVFADREQPDWPWCDKTVTYDNARLPQALIVAGINLDQKEMIDRGVRVLKWLVELQTTPQGTLSIIGNRGWYPRGGERARFDQQPLEPAALIGACKAAYRATSDAKWLAVMRRCFEWYLGRNDLDVSMIDFKTRGCYDGLESTGVNRNQGAESVVSWLLSLLIMHEMQTGDIVDVG